MRFQIFTNITKEMENINYKNYKIETCFFYVLISSFLNI